MHTTWVDLIIVAVLLYQIRDGWERGFTSLLANLGSFLISLWLAVRFHTPVGNFFVEKFGISVAWTDVLGYITVAIVSQVVIEELMLYGLGRIPKKFHASRMNKWLGAALSLVNASIMVSFVLILILSLPLRGTVKADIRSSFLGKWLVVMAEKYGGSVQSSLSEISKGAAKFLTIEPDSKELIPLDIHTADVVFNPDAVNEQRMADLVNKERSAKGLPPLRVDGAMTGVARGKSKDMFDRRYFSHYDPDGKNAADRLHAAAVPFTLAGENLAYAPDLTSAHQGLMNSPGHRENILDPRFHRIGIGIIDGGIYGKMFTQLFAD